MPARSGDWAEAVALGHLQAAGLRLVERNYRCRFGEIDLIMRDGDCLVFVEVRQRRNRRFGSGADSIDGRKRRKLALTAEHFLQARGGDGGCRFDVVSLDADNRIDWIPGAFDAS